MDKRKDTMADRRGRDSIEDMARIQAGLEQFAEKLARGEQITEEPEKPKEKNLWDDTELEFDEIIWQEPDEPAAPKQAPKRVQRPIRQKEEPSAEWEKYRVPIDEELFEDSFGTAQEFYEEPVETYEEPENLTDDAYYEPEQEIEESEEDSEYPYVENFEDEIENFEEDEIDEIEDEIEEEEPEEEPAEGVNVGIAPTVQVIPVRHAEEEEVIDWDRKPTKEERIKKAEKKAEEKVKEHTKEKKSKRVSKKEEKAMEPVPEKPKKKKKHPFRKLLIFLGVILFLYFGGVYALTNYAYGKLKYEKVDSVAKESIKDDGVINVLLIGNDSRENGEDGRSDAMILLSVSKKTKKIYMTSLLRDMYVEIPGHDGNRLNAAYSFGGPELLMKTIEQNFGIEVNRYMQVNFEAFAGLVDAVEGVDLELTQEELVYVNGYLVEYNMLTGREQGTDNMDTEHPGMVHMNGPQALAYSRNRYLGTDFGRTERQRKVLGQVFKKLPKAAIKHPKLLMETLLPNLTTNMTKSECYKIALSAPWMIGYDIEQASIPLQGTYHDSTIRKMAVLEVDFEANKQFIQENIYGKTK